MDLSAHALSAHPQLAQATIELIGREWPRSPTARATSLDLTPSVPLSANILIVARPFSSAVHPPAQPVSASQYTLSRAWNCDGRCSIEGCAVVAHAKLVPVEGDEHACAMECVVVDGDWRGRGVGRALVRTAEDYARRAGALRVFVGIDAECVDDFYAALGYEPHGCSVRPVRARAQSLSAKSRALQSLLSGGVDEGSSCASEDSNLRADQPDESVAPSLSAPPPPPPAPLPAPVASRTARVRWMVRHLCSLVLGTYRDK
eukprot:Opistho-1_new@2765